jgi:ABC-type Fe3+/spermidine/putrescine transport system ATPase subunit
MVFQSYALFPHMSVERNVSYGLKLKKVSPVDIARKVNDMLDLVGLAGYGGRMPHELSGGQQQRVQLARSLVLESDVILLDEPLAALDANLRKDMCFELKRIQEQVGITFIHVTHNQEEALTIADRIAIVADGKLAEEGTPKEIYERPVKKFTAEFIGENNLLEGKVSEINGEQATIDLGYAQITIIRPNNTAVAGTKIALSIPSEIVDISDGKPTETGNIQFLEAVFISNSYAGYSSFNLVRLADGTEMASRAPVKGERQQMKPGQTVCVSWPTEAGRLHVT